MIIITGGAGFIGSNIIKALNDAGEDKILVVDNLSNGKKIHNLADLNIEDYLDRLDFIELIKRDTDFGCVKAVFHEGACSTTTEWDGHFIMKNNYEYSKILLDWCLSHKVQYLYASSASVYGNGSHGFHEDRECEYPINMYAYSKFQFDQYVRSLSKKHKSFESQVVGFRYFNVYGPRENHKGSMASTALHFHKQILESGVAKLFAGSDGYADGEQRRDFVYVGDIARVNLWFLQNPDKSGLYNLGTGHSQSFNNMANAVIKWHTARGRKGKIEYIPFPDYLQGAYQSFTEADISALREAGYLDSFRTIEEGVSDYLDWLSDCSPDQFS